MNKVQNYRGSVAIKLEQVAALEQSVDVATDLFKGARPEVEYMDVLFAQRDLLEARTDLIETKQQQLSAIVNAYRALGGGYLVTGAGPEFGELFCLPPVEIDPAEVLGPADPDDAQQPVPSPLPAPNGADSGKRLDAINVSAASATETSKGGPSYRKIK
jgi:multidrug efflux system outer membrane protein